MFCSIIVLCCCSICLIKFSSISSIKETTFPALLWYLNKKWFLAISGGNQLHQQFMHMTSGLLTSDVNTFLSLFSSLNLPSFSSHADYLAFPEVTPPYLPDLSAAHVLSLTFLLLISQGLMAPFCKEDMVVSPCFSLYHVGLWQLFPFGLHLYFYHRRCEFKVHKWPRVFRGGAFWRMLRCGAGRSMLNDAVYRTSSPLG